MSYKAAPFPNKPSNPAGAEQVKAVQKEVPIKRKQNPSSFKPYDNYIKWIASHFLKK
jgi:hypothetical protein